jgi:hypothetical protein
VPRSILFAFPVLALLPAGGPSRAAAPSDVAAAKRALQAAVDSASAPALLQARARFVSLSAAEPDDAALHQWVAVATWRTVPLLQRSDAARAERVLRDGLEHADVAIRLAPKDGEALAVKAALQGLLMRFDPGAMMTLGPESEANLARAQVLSPRSPRVWLLQGVHTLHKPAAFGGSAGAARVQLARAIELFAGQAAMQLGDFAAAESLYAGALARDSANRWVGAVLLPAARDSLARRKP